MDRTTPNLALRRLRVTREWDYEELSLRSGVSAEQIRKIESGRTRSPRIATLAKLASAFGDSVTAADIDPVLAEVA